MKKQLLEVNVSTPETILVLCPHCNRSREFNQHELQPDCSNPFTFECSCGTPSRVLLNFRKVYRKNLKLAGKFTLSSGTRIIDVNCIVLALSMIVLLMRPVSSQNIA